MIPKLGGHFGFVVLFSVRGWWKGRRWPGVSVLIEHSGEHSGRGVYARRRQTGGGRGKMLGGV